MLNFAFDRGYDNRFRGDSWASNDVTSGTNPTHGSVDDYDQRALAFNFAETNRLGVRGTTYGSIPSGGISSTPTANQAVTSFYLVDQKKRRPDDLFKEEISFNVKGERALNGMSAQHVLGLHAVKNWLHDSEDERALDIGRDSTYKSLDEAIKPIWSVITTPYHDAQNRPANNETFVVAGRARLQDVWAMQATDDQHGVREGSYLWLLYVRRTKKTPRVHLNPHLPHQRPPPPVYEWDVQVIATPTCEVPVYLYCSENPDASGSVFRGKHIYLGWYMRELTNTNHGFKPFTEHARVYHESKDTRKQFEGYRQLRSIEVMIRQ